MTKNIPYCCNCGKNGHSYRRCLAPIISLGIILFKKTKTDDIKYLLIQRRDTLGFVEFIRGKYNLENIKYIHTLFEIMTLKEREKIINMNFNDLWNNLWMSQNNQYHNEYDNSKKKFNLLKEGIYIKDTLYSLNIINDSAKKIYETPEWGFPKGRREKRESDLDCAIREFTEETGLKNNYNILHSLKPVEELFSGTNNIRYKHIYYIAESTSESEELEIDKNNVNQVTEISNIGWFSYNDAMKNIRPYNVEKKNVLDKVNNILNSKKNITEL